MNDHQVSASLAFRKNEAAILRGDVPEKYTRLLPHIPGDRILEIGSAEGVLALLLARADAGNKEAVTALEKRQERHASAIALHREWAQRYPFSAQPCFVNGKISDCLDLLEGVDTLVAIRMIYYLGADLDRVFAAAAEWVPNVVLCGNKNRSTWWREGIPNRNDRADNYYASPEGMTELLTRHGYRIVNRVLDGDPIVVGSRG